MPNYKEQPDGWHLIIPMLAFYLMLITSFIWSIYNWIKTKVNTVDLVIILIVATFLFAMINNPHGNSEEIGYIGLLILTVVHGIVYYRKRKMTEPNNS